MTLLLVEGKQSEILSIFQSQIDVIRSKKAVTIKLSNFPSGVSLANVCEALSEFLLHITPPVHLERILLSDNCLTTLPTEFLLLCGALLRYIDLHNNDLSEVPAVLGNNCSRLEGLDLSLNRLWLLRRHVFSNLGQLKMLQLRDNNFTYLPPILGEMISLEAIGISENPLVLPTMETVRSMSGGVNDLKAYLISNSAVLEQQIQQQLVQTQKQIPTTPSLSRTRSLSDNKSKSLKATRRMGLIINSNKSTPEEVAVSGNTSDMTTPSKPERKLLLPNLERGEYSTSIPRSSIELSFNIDLASVPSTYTASTALNSCSTSPTLNANSTTGLTRPVSLTRLRSNTLREINNILEHSDLADSEHKSGAYFRRLSTLQELPSDEGWRTSTTPHAPLISDNGEEDSTKTLPPAPSAHSQFLESSPLKVSTKRTSILNLSKTPHHSQQQQLLQNFYLPLHHQHHQQSSQLNLNPQTPAISVQPHTHDLATVVKVARKILFSFSELHLSIRRFTGFCSDKKVAMRAVALLHTTKGNIDNLVETMELVEGNGENQDLIMNAMHTCISSFRSILAFLSDNLASFLAKIDVCFIRMVYLTLFGSFNEFQNAYRLLNPMTTSSKPMIPQLSRNHSALSLPTVEAKSKQQQAQLQVTWDFHGDALPSNHDTTPAADSTTSLEEIDEKLYQSIDIATSNAQVVFSELTKAIGKSAIATANSNASQPINPTVTAKFKELTSVCLSSMEVTKRLIAKLSTVRTSQSSQSRRLFWDDINLFLKAIIQTFSSVKIIMKDAPILNEVRQSMASLTKTTKELTILLEASSYKSMSELLVPLQAHQQAMLGSASVVLPTSVLPQLLTSNSTLNLSQMNGTAPVRTPLVATVGAVAAQAILPPTDQSHSVMSAILGATPMGINIPPLVSSDVLNTGLHTAPVQSMEQYYAKSVNPFDKT